MIVRIGVEKLSAARDSGASVICGTPCFRSGGSFEDAIGDGQQAAFDQLSGELHASIAGMFLDDSRFIREAAGTIIAPSTAYAAAVITRIGPEAYEPAIAADPDADEPRMSIT